MNDDSRQWTPDEREALAALATLQPALPGQQARQRTRQAFLQGAAARRRPGGPFTWAGLAAAAVLAFLVVFGYQPAQQYRITDLVAPAGVKTGSGDLAVGQVLPDGLVRTDPGSEIEVLLGENLRLRIIGGSEITLPRPPGRWFGRSMQVDVAAGEVYGTSGDSHPDFEVVLATEEARATLLGTTFAGFRTPEYTCFCLFEGGLMVDVLETGAQEILPVGNRIFIYREDGRTDIGPLNDMETMKLQMMQDAGVPAAAVETP